MLSSFRDFVIKQFVKIKRRNVRPLSSHHFDLKLIRTVRRGFLPNVRQWRNLKHTLSNTERLVIRTCYFLIFIAIMWLGIGILWQKRTVVPAIGGRYVEAVVGSPQYVNPIFAGANDVDVDLSRLIFSGLMRYDKDYHLLPDLAAKYEISADKKIYKFELRKDVVWHDNEPFTSKDVIFTFDTIQNISVGSPMAVSFQGVEVKAIDDYTVQFTLPEPYTPFLSSLTVGILPEHVWFNVQPEQIRLAQTNIQPVGSGPFMFRKFTKDESGKIYNYELARFDRFYREASYISEFVFQFYSEYENDTGAVQALRSQKVSGLSFVPKYLRDKVERKHVVLHPLVLPQYTAVFFNSDHNQALKDKNVRLALKFALDKDRILQVALKGEGKIISNPILPNTPGFDEKVGKVDFSIVEANKLLDTKWTKISATDYRAKRREVMVKEWEKNNTSTSTMSAEEKAEGLKNIDTSLDNELSAVQTTYRQDKDGNLLQVELVTADTEEFKKTAELIAGFWQEVGVKVNLKFVSTKSVVKEAIRDRAYDVFLYGEIIGAEGDLFSFWHSSQINYPGLNLSRYVNRTVDGYLEKVRTTSDVKELTDLNKKLADLISAELPAVFLYMPTYTFATGDEIKGISAERISLPADRFAGVTDWYIKTKWKFNW